MTTMKSFWIGSALASALILLTSTAFAADPVPRIDAAGACREAAHSDLGVVDDADQCIKSEQEAHNQLTREWGQYSPADRTLCTRTATMGGTASYVELITCLEMQRDARQMDSAPARLKPMR